MMGKEQKHNHDKKSPKDLWKIAGRRNRGSPRRTLRDHQTAVIVWGGNPQNRYDWDRFVFLYSLSFQDEWCCLCEREL